jgi:SAM-dependent methyltransferase
MFRPSPDPTSPTEKEDAMATATQTVDQKKLEQFIGQFVQDFGAALHSATVVLGDRLGLYKALAREPANSAELAQRTRTDERHVREWLHAQAASGYISYDAAADRYYLDPEQAFALADENGLSIPGAFLVSAALVKDEPRLLEAFRSGRGLGWHEHHDDLFTGTERFFRPNYNAHLVESWLPALDGVKARLEAGAKVADVGCGHGASTILMAQAFPRSNFTGFDYHEASIIRAREAALDAGVAGPARFRVATAKDYPGRDYDLVAFFDCLHDMGDPAGVARHVRESLKPDGTWMIVEPFAHERATENYNPLGRLYYSASTLICTPCSKAQEVGLALGSQASEARLKELVMQGGFTRFRRAAETPFNRVFEARP